MTKSRLHDQHTYMNPKMKHFLLFAGYTYYPTGGIGDLIHQLWASDIELDNGLNTLREMAARYDWWEICVIDTHGMRLFESGPTHER